MFEEAVHDQRQAEEIPSTHSSGVGSSPLFLRRPPNRAFAGSPIPSFRQQDREGASERERPRTTADSAEPC